MSDPHGQLLEIFDRTAPRLHALLFRITLDEHVAEDLLQDLFVKLSQSDAFRRADDADAYVVRSAANLAFDWRRRHRAAAVSLDAAGEPPVADAAVADALANREQYSTLLDALATMPEASREILAMRFFDQQGYAAIGAHLNKSAHQARALCHKAIKRLRAIVSPPLASEQSEARP